MLRQFDSVTRWFAEESRASEADEFFGIFDAFLTSFSTAHIENDRFRREKEIEEKRLKVESQVRVKVVTDACSDVFVHPRA